MTNTMICNECGTGALSVGTWTAEIRHNEKLLSVSDLECYVCSNCGADPVYADQIRRNQLKIVDAKRVSDSLWTSAEIIAFRERHCLTQSQAASIFGGGANAFSKYERGEVIQSVAMDNQLKLADEVAGALKFLALKAGVVLTSNALNKSSYSTSSKIITISERMVALNNDSKMNVAYSSDYPVRKRA